MNYIAKRPMRRRGKKPDQSLHIVWRIDRETFCEFILSYIFAFFKRFFCYFQIFFGFSRFLRHFFLIGIVIAVIVLIDAFVRAVFRVQSDP